MAVDKSKKLTDMVSFLEESDFTTNYILEKELWVVISSENCLEFRWELFKNEKRGGRELEFGF